MQSIKRLMRRTVNTVLSPLDLEIVRRGMGDSKNECFNNYLDQAQKANMDVNDWIENELGWGNALVTLKKTTFDYLKNNSIVCEIGPGTGRHARYIFKKIIKGQLHLVDHSHWCINFLQNYFDTAPNVHVHLGDGCAISCLDNDSVDLVFSNGTFIELKLGNIYLYSREFARILKPGGYCVFDYIDINTLEGWNHLETQSHKYANCFTYHTSQIVDKVFKSVGFEIIQRCQIGKSTYFVARTPVS